MNQFQDKKQTSEEPFNKVEYIEIILKEGNILFIPKGWWYLRVNQSNINNGSKQFIYFILLKKQYLKNNLKFLPIYEYKLTLLSLSLSISIQSI